VTPYKEGNILTVGSQVRKYRNLKGWTLRELGERSGLAISTLSDTELDKTSSVRVLVKISKALGISIDYLFKEE